jgi:voltage-gated potassium channel
MPRSALQNNLNEIIFGTETQAGKIFDLILLVAILLSVTAVFLDSIVKVSIQQEQFLYRVEWFFTALFTVEYLVRLYASPYPVRYARSFFGIVDLISIAPAYIALFLSGSQYFLLVRLLRTLRLFRILKLLRYSTEANMLMRAIYQSHRKIFVFLMVVVIFATLFGSVIYIVEGPQNGFTSIPQSIYWAIVTITTVGYGDLVPITPLGKVLAGCVMVLGYSIIAVPTGILTAELANEMKLDRSDRRCKHCGRAGHDMDAVHCKHCGRTLKVKNESS